MKTLFNSKILLLLIIMGIFSSCKNNHDGYSDEIDTHKTTVDTSGIISDTTNIDKSNGANAAGSNASKVNTGTNNPNASSAGTGSGPGPDPNDGSVYTSSSGVRKDSVDVKPAKNKEK